MKPWLPPIRIQPYPTESLPGFFIRLCDVNGWWSYRDLTKKLGISQDELRYQAGDLRALETKLGLAAGSLPLPGSRLGQNPSTIGGQSFRSRSFHSARRVCPACIAETGYQRSYWDFTFITRCHLHGAMLETTCTCGSPLKWTDPALASCSKCMVDEPRPRKAQSAPPSPFQQWCLGALGVSASAVQVPAMAGASVAEAVALTGALALIQRFGFSKSRPTTDIADDQLCEEGFEIVDNGQAGALIARVVSQFKAEGGSDCPLIPADALGWFGDLVLAFRKNSLSAIMDDITASLAKALGYGVTDIAKSDFVSLGHLSRLTGHSRETFRRALEASGSADLCLQVSDVEFVVPVSLVLDLRRDVGEWG